MTTNPTEGRGERVSEEDCPRTRKLMASIERFGYSAANEQVLTLCWELERELLQHRRQSHGAGEALPDELWDAMIHASYLMDKEFVRQDREAGRYPSNSLERRAAGNAADETQRHAVLLREFADKLLPHRVAPAQPSQGECETCRGKGYEYEGEAITGRGPEDVFPEKVSCDDCNGTGQRGGGK